jgi:hypothetical protein
MSKMVHTFLGKIIELQCTTKHGGAIDFHYRKHDIRCHGLLPFPVATMAGLILVIASALPTFVILQERREDSH